MSMIQGSPSGTVFVVRTCISGMYMCMYMCLYMCLWYVHVYVHIYGSG